jgi:hypothetical protein
LVPSVFHPDLATPVDPTGSEAGFATVPRTPPRPTAMLEWGSEFVSRATPGQIWVLGLDVTPSTCQPKRVRDGRTECLVMVYSGGRPNPGSTIEDYQYEYAFTVDEVDVGLELQAADGSFLARGSRQNAGATPGYHDVIESWLPPGRYLVEVVVTSGVAGRFSVQWTPPLGD